jgi:hypothetical protein
MRLDVQHEHHLYLHQQLFSNRFPSFFCDDVMLTRTLQDNRDLCSDWDKRKYGTGAEAGGHGQSYRALSQWMVVHAASGRSAPRPWLTTTNTPQGPEVFNSLDVLPVEVMCFGFKMLLMVQMSSRHLRDIWVLGFLGPEFL